MVDVFITFGQIHVHSVGGKTFDKDCVAHIRAKSEEDGRRLAFEYFGDKWFTSYSPDPPGMEFFPRGIIQVK